MRESRASSEPAEYYLELQKKKKTIVTNVSKLYQLLRF